jgi:putative acetyltransferase
MLVRREVEGDAGVVREVEAAAFARGDGEPVEAWLAVELRTSGQAIPELSLVAVVDGVVVGHVVCSRGWVGDVPAVGLGPIGVLPELQGKGIGNALMHAVLGAADALGEPLVALLGDPGFYGRFGFVTSTVCGIEPPEPAWGEHFQVRTLTAYRPEIVGVFRYADAFSAV